jgi:electron transfer flavoprotein beta subunit
MIAVTWKWMADPGDDRSPGTSLADEAALEVALRLAHVSGDTVTVITVGPPDADRGLRAALAAGATRAVRVDSPRGLTSDAVAAALAPVVAGASWTVCGDHSPDRGSGAVPAYLAAELGVAQALGLVTVEPVDVTSADALDAVRRLDGGRREVLRVEAPGVVSVEGGVATLRRAALRAELAARTAPIEVVAGPRGPLDQPVAAVAYRPRARVLPAPTGPVTARLRDLLGTDDVAATPAEIVVLDPVAAAQRILAVVRPH